MSGRLVYEMSRMVLAEQDGQAIVLKVAMDESGVHDGSPVIAVGAYIGRPRQWEVWTKRWNVAKRPIKVFHAVDCQNLTEEFKGWTEPQRDELVKRILPVIADTDIPGVVVGIQMLEFEKAIRGRDDLRPIFGTPYAACFQWVVQIIMNFALGALNTERIGFVHELNDYRQEALESFNWIKKHGNPLGTLSGCDLPRKKITSHSKPRTFSLMRATSAYAIRVARSGALGPLSIRIKRGSSRLTMVAITWQT
jgi:hypothetical protein